MFKKLTTTTLFIFLLASLAACGGSSKKKKVDNLGTDDDKSKTTKDDNNKNKNKEITFLEKEKAGIANRMEDAQFFRISRNGIGDHQIIYFPARKDSRNPQDHDERWYFRNPTIEHFADKKSGSSNVAFRIYPKADQNSATTFEFELSPVVEADIEELAKLSQLELTLADNGKDSEVIIKCGNVIETYEAETHAGNVGLAYYPLNSDDDSYDYFQSPCAIYDDQMLEEGLKFDDQGSVAKVDQEGDENDDNNNQTEEDSNECIDYDAAETEEASDCEKKEVAKTTCNESLFMRYHVKVICHHGIKMSCSQTITPVGIVSQSSTEVSCESTCAEMTCSSSSTTVETEVAGSAPRMAEAGQLSDIQLLRYCSAKDQRTYMRKSEKIQKVEEEISALVDYCAYRPELGKHCEATRMHDLHKKIDRKKKDQAKIIATCIKERDEDAARGDYSQPEMNTCGFITRGTLTNHRNNLNAYEAELNHLQAKCQSQGECDNKREEKLKSKISHRQHKIQKLEKKCNVDM